MQISLSKPRYERFIEEQISGGRFASAAEVVEAGLSKLMEDESGEELDDETYAKILRANDQIDRGEGRSLQDVKSVLDQHMADGDYARPSTDGCRMIGEDERRNAWELVEAKLIARLEDPRSVEVNEADWAQIRAQFSCRLSNRGGQ